ncbi:MAG: adenylate/guanylate cyclase domain-containing protein [Chthoniobacterales bacterium]
MRSFKATLLLGSITAVLLFLAAMEGWVAPLGEAWKGVLHVTLGHAGTSEIAPSMQGVIVFLLAFVTVWIGLEVNTYKERFLLALFAGILIISGSLVLALYHFFWNPFPAELALGLSSLMVLFFLRTTLGSRQPRLRSIFGGRFHPQFIRNLVDGAMSLQFLGELKYGSILVCALNNHAELMELLTPEAYVEMTNLYLQVATNFLVDVGGYLEECSGESIRVLFGIPLPLEGAMNHGAKAVRAALDLVKRLDELNSQCDARWQQRLDFRIGVHSGEMIAAIYGGPRLSQYGVAGPVVEFARYLCTACINYGCRILVGPNTYEMAENSAEFRPIDLLKRQGIRRHVELYEVLASKNSLSMERERSRDLFWQGVLFFRSQEWDKAVEAFTAARIFGIPDGALDLYLERIDRARRGEDLTITSL